MIPVTIHILTAFLVTPMRSRRVPSVCWFSACSVLAHLADLKPARSLSVCYHLNMLFITHYEAKHLCGFKIASLRDPQVDPRTCRGSTRSS